MGNLLPFNAFYHVLLSTGEKGTSNLSYVARNCKELLDQGVVMSGWYTIYPDGMAPLQVLCDMDTDGGGWIVFQRRYDGSVDFYLGWDSYRRGFGSRLTEFWLGNDNLSNFTSAGTWEMRVDMKYYDNIQHYAKYSSFKVLPESDSYRLIIGPYVAGDAGDSIIRTNYSKFTTKDRDNDDMPVDNCADFGHGAWWYTSCYNANLNGLYLIQGYSIQSNCWLTLGNYYSLKFSEMKMRPA
ncbi:ficolin-1-like isoform X1 [Xenopus tropicalis]|uniref:Ficolin-1-like n=1 Tax=Xenopus tropicalis TaxID=8364 RepID=A0A803J904_XENTR|nr:ficolin-1-like isoform X1 [Xenopus tropicalis]